jgi:hypothetical protein
MNKILTLIKHYWIKLQSFIDESFYLLFVQLALITITGIDWIIHSLLYHFGLQFSYVWAIPYWCLLNILFWIIAFLSVSAYFIDREPINKIKGLAVFGTSMIEFYFNILDSLFFLIERVVTGQWGNAFTNWWWSPFSWIFGYWDLSSNIILNIIGIIIIITIWFKIRTDYRKV